MLTIKLDDPEESYAQGDLVTGQVTYRPVPKRLRGLEPERVRIVVEVTGQTETTFISEFNGSYPEGRGDLLWIQVAEITGTAGEWPFAFSFPARASPVDISVVDTSAWTRQMMTVRSDHLLPPTFYEVPGAGFIARAGYYVQVSVWSHSAPKRPEKIADQRVPITFWPRYNSQYEFPTSTAGDTVGFRADFKVKSSLLPAINQTGGKSKSLFRRALVPCLKFQVRLVLPTKVHIGEEISCVLSVYPLLESSDTCKNLVFNLKSFSIRVTGRTKVWASTTAEEKDSTKSSHGTVLDKSNDKLDVPLSPSSNYSKTILTPGFQDLVPTFSTYNIARTYSLRISVDIGCVDTISTLSKETELVVLPSESSTAPPAYQAKEMRIVETNSAADYLSATSNILGAVGNLVGGF